MTSKFALFPAKRAVMAVFLGLLGLCPVRLFAQTMSAVPALPVENRVGLDYEGRAIVAVLPLTGTEPEMVRRFHEGTIEAVAALGKYNPRDVHIPAGGEIPTDMPPVPSLVPGVRYALTGGVYPGSSPGEYYLQLWLWDMAGSTMIYTDDLVYDDIDGAMESLPGLVEWLFSHIRMALIETPPSPAWLDPLFMLGVRAGLSSRWYADPDEISPGASAVNPEGAVSGALRLSPLLSFQLELLFTQDTVAYRGLDLVSTPPAMETKAYKNLSLTIPLLLKANFKAGLFRISPLAGFYLVLPLGQSRYLVNDEGPKESPSWSLSIPMGFTLGIEGARQYGSGRIFTGLRYGIDFGSTTINHVLVPGNGEKTQYQRQYISLYLGYEFGFYDGKKLGGL
jgi:hypothetical protein